MKTVSVLISSFFLGALALSGCRTFRYTGYYSHSDAFPQLHYDWAKEPHFPSPQGREPHLKLNFPRTSDEHRKAAQVYIEKAKEYRTEAGIHRGMTASYEGNDSAIVAECDQLIKRLEDMADQMERFAKWHEDKAQGQSDRE